MAVVHVCDVCGSQNSVKRLDFQTYREEDFESYDVCDACELRMLRNFKHELIDEAIKETVISSKYYFYKKLLGIFNMMVKK